MNKLLDKYKAGLEIQQRLLSYLETKANEIERVNAMLEKASLPRTIKEQRRIMKCLYVRWISTVKLNHFRSILIDVNVRLSQLEAEMDKLRNVR